LTFLFQGVPFGQILQNALTAAGAKEGADPTVTSKKYLQEAKCRSEEDSQLEGGGGGEKKEREKQQGKQRSTSATKPRKGQEEGKKGRRRKSERMFLV